MDSLLDIGASLVRSRRAADLSQRELAEALGTSQQQVARWEASAYRSASLERVAAVADALGIPANGEPVATESKTAYLPSAPRTARATEPVRDLGETAARLRAHGTELRESYRINRIGVFGSFATGEQSVESDVDLLVETEDPGGMRFVEAALFLEDVLGRPVDLVRPHLLHDRLRDRVAAEVVYVWSA